MKRKEHDKAKLEKDKEEKHRALIIGDSTLRFANNDAVNGDIISIPGAKLGHMANSLMYNQDLDTYDTIAIVAGNNSYDSNITKEQAKAEIKEQLKMVEKVTEDFLKEEDKEITLVEPFPMPAKESVSNIPESVAQVMRGCKKGNVEITREMNLTKDDFTANGIHPNLNGTSIIMQKISSHIPDCFISTDLVAEREYSSVKLEHKYGCKVCCKGHYTADCDKLSLIDQKTAKRRGKRSNIVLSLWQMIISNTKEMTRDMITKEGKLY